MNKVDKSGSGIVDKLLSAVNALTKRVNYLKFELREKKMIKRLTHIVEGNFNNHKNQLPVIIYGTQYSRVE